MIFLAILFFFAVQIFFTFADLAYLWKINGAPSLKALLEKEGSSIEMLFFFWVLYFILQVSGVTLIPSIDQVTLDFHRWLGLPFFGFPLSFKEGVVLVLLHGWTYLAVSFWDYVTHRWVLHHPWFWLFHEYHHLPKVVFNGMPGISVRPFVFVTTSLTYLGVLPCLWIPLQWLVSERNASLFLQTLPMHSLILTIVLSAVHSPWLRTFRQFNRWLQKIGMTTPLEHTLHHSCRLDGNYGNFSCVWDHLFGTYIDPQNVSPEHEPLGLSYDQDFLGVLCRGMVKMPKKWRDKSQIHSFCRIK